MSDEKIPKRVTITTKGETVTLPCEMVHGTDEFTCTTPEGEKLRFRVDDKKEHITIISKDGSQTFPCKTVSNEAEPIGTTATGKKFGFMIIDPGMFSKEDLVYMKRRQVPLYDIWKCICHESNYAEVSEAIGSSLCVKMGPDLGEFLDSLGGQPKGL